MPNKHASFKEYDIELAAEALRILVYEAHPSEECAKKVWLPTQEVLYGILSQGSTLPCLATPSQSGECFLFLVGLQKKIAYLGMVSDKEKSLAFHEWLLKTYGNKIPGSKELLEKSGPMAIVRDYSRCHIPTNYEKLDKQAMNGAVKKYMQIFAPKLACAKIKWLPNKEQNDILQAIATEARRRSNPTTKEQESEIYLKDMELFM